MVLVLGNASKPGVSEEGAVLPILQRCAEIAAIDLRREMDLSQVRGDMRFNDPFPAPICCFSSARILAKMATGNV